MRIYIYIYTYVYIHIYIYIYIHSTVYTTPCSRHCTQDTDAAACIIALCIQDFGRSGPHPWKVLVQIHTCHILHPSEIDLGLCLAVFAGSGGKYIFHRIG